MPFYAFFGHKQCISQTVTEVVPLIWMVKLFFIQIWFGLSDPQTEELMHDWYAVQQFLGLDLGRDRPPDETTILRFRHLIEEHDAVGAIRGFSRVSNMSLQWQRR